MEKLPIILTVGVQNNKSEDVVKLILGKDQIKGTVVNEKVTAYAWNIDNKYYSADVYLYTLNSKDSSVKNFEQVDVILLYGDFNSVNCVDELNDWISYIHNIRPAIKVLLYDNPVQDESKKDTVLQWCIENKFEMVELELESADKDATTELAESIGIERVVEILHAHQWPNLTLKEKSLPLRVNYNDLHNVSESSKRSTTDLRESDNDSNDSSNMENPIEHEFANMNQLSMLFNNLKFMKEDITSLDGQERLNQAEKVVKEFWNAINGDSDEFSEDENV